jgi:acetyl-CoA carboxylase biotin carboxylase subunit
VSARRIESVLVANRGEIAVRIIRTLKALGLRAIAVFSEADRDSLAVQLADDAALIGPAPAKESYLRIDRLIEATRRHGADAIHPGYGFLSEREELARAVEEAGLVFLGPTPANIRALGDKLAARRAMAKAGIGPVPGSDQPFDDLEAARRFAAAAGFPLLLKAAAGGGGKGIRVVRRPEELESAFLLARSEAESSFGSPALFAERYLERARHVEIQVIGDGHGGARLFCERDCSIQRRLQKLLEETPSPGVSAATRDRLLEAARLLVEATRYRSAGTLEFLQAEDGQLYFLEMNTRIQVEHPVTEVTAGVDIVAEQVRVAGGARFGRGSLEALLVPPRGAAVELRINAEDPLDDFRPAAGKIEALYLPSGPGLRIDTALLPGMEVTPFYDPLLAKVIAWGEDRAQALARLAAALREIVVSGVATTLPVGTALLEDPEFLRGEYHCQFLASRLEESGFLRARVPAADLQAVAAAVALLEARRRAPREPPTGPGRGSDGGPGSAWRRFAAGPEAGATGGGWQEIP